jgi:microsomal dipeptidase-like Zn-dependent dipeptidase
MQRHISAKILGLFFLSMCVSGCVVAPKILEKSMNKVRQSPPYTVSDEAKAVHEQLSVVDLHADPLLWNRNLLKKHSYGHIDFPRLREANVAIQVFGVVTKTPKKMNFESNPSNTDNITALAMLQCWPHRTWGSLFERALYEAEKLKKFEKKSDGNVMVIRSVSDLNNLLEKRKTNPEIVGGILSLEGVQALEGDLKNLDALYDAGFRIIGLTHFFDNEAAGSAHGVDKGGLTPFGKDLVKKIQEKHMIIDLAHASPKTIDDVLVMTSGPVIVSHTGVKGMCNNIRNLSDAHVKQIAATGGVMGIAMFEETVCGKTIKDTARSIRYVANLVGVDHVAVGSDFDGAVTAPTDITGMPLLTEALMDEGFSDEDIAKIMGGNAIRVFSQVLPAE